MSLWGRLALAMVFLVVATICALSLFNSGFFAVGRPVLAAAALAILLALVLAVATARSLSGLSTQLKTKQGLLENTVESIRDCVIVRDENGMVGRCQPRGATPAWRGAWLQRRHRDSEIRSASLPTGRRRFRLRIRRWRGRCAAKMSTTSNSWCCPNKRARRSIWWPTHGRCAMNQAISVERLRCSATSPNSGRHTRRSSTANRSRRPSSIVRSTPSSRPTRMASSWTGAHKRRP